MKRRTVLKNMALVSGTTLLPKVSSLFDDAKPKTKKLLRIAHITDVHLTHKNNAPKKFKSCIKEIKKHKVDFFLNGGDSIMAADYKEITRSEVNRMWELWKDCRKSFSNYQMYSCLGNHDMWWEAPTKTDPMYGKLFVVNQLKMPAPYYSFSKEGWHFIVLDSNNDGGGHLGDQQMHWLNQQLKRLSPKTPVLIMSHYPILSASTHAVGGNHKDSLAITKLFYKHRDKPIHCISGHVHLVDTCVYNNVNYYCNGAISGFWWGKGDETSAGEYWYHETPPGYTILDLYADGSLQCKYHPVKY